MDILELKTENEINKYFETLLDRGVNAIAIDIEGEYNLHCYGEHLCLIQIYDLENSIIIDPLRFQNRDVLLRILKTVFESRRILKIMYDSSSDASLLKNKYNTKIDSVLDLRPAVQLLDYEKQSLTNVLDRELNIVPLEKKKFQMYNWMKRPIKASALNYAICDVIYLFELKRILFEKLINKNLLDDYILMNLMVQNKEIDQDTENKYKKRQGYVYLSQHDKEKYRFIYDTREKYAEKINKPPYLILSNQNLLNLIKNQKNIYDLLNNNVYRKMDSQLRIAFIDELMNKLYS